MCGIVGVAAKAPIRSRGWLAAGRDAMAHRGPDDAGEYWSDDGRVGFGHRRLSIIDLSAAGHQPMQTPDGQFCITFNGEIYNYAKLKQSLNLVVTPSAHLRIRKSSLRPTGNGARIAYSACMGCSRLRFTTSGRRPSSWRATEPKKSPCFIAMRAGNCGLPPNSKPFWQTPAAAAGQSRSARLLSGGGLHFR